MSKIIMFRNGNGYVTDIIGKIEVNLKITRTAQMERGETVNDVRLLINNEVHVRSVLKFRDPKQENEVLHKGALLSVPLVQPLVVEGMVPKSVFSMVEDKEARRIFKSRVRKMGSAYDAMMQYRRILQEMSTQTERPPLPNASILLDEAPRPSTASASEYTDAIAERSELIDAHIRRVNEILKENVAKEASFENFGELENAVGNEEAELVITEDLLTALRPAYVEYLNNLAIGEI